MRNASTYNPDQTLDGVAPQDIQDNCIEDRHIADNEINASKANYIGDGAALAVVITKSITTGAASVKIYDADAPFKFEVLEVIVQPRGASTNGTMKVTDGTTDITDAMTCAVDKTIARATTIDDAAATIAAGGTLEVVCAGDTVGDTVGLVTIIAVKRA